MSDRDEKKTSGKSASSCRCCYYVVDSCGCPIGTLCCDDAEGSKCHFERCC